ncbi:hypothetical protein Taro_027519 [Colocasia esculenta]|uniref:C2H2-type domain-containing protein n=1 Tax=Colocasia esculenta TaxID=4460 RepID=A0A843V8Y3_COLES|nr:hypothetical protein [Colocasia esculenta]
MAALRSFFANFRAAVLLLLVYLGCIFFSPAAASPRPQPKRRKISPLSHHQPPASSGTLKPHRSLSLSLRSYLRHLFSFSRPGRPTQLPQEQQVEALAPVVPAQPHLHVHLVEGDKSENRNPLKVISSSGSPAARVPAIAAVANAASGKRSSFASRDDVFPCVACGEVFSKIHLLDLHQATRHAFSELADGDSGKNIVQIIFQSGWKGRGKGNGRGDEAPVVHRVFKIHNSAKTIARFEEYRESVRSRAAARWASGRGGGGEERCVADGNERLRFYCATFMCGLGREGNLGTCGSPFCAACGIVRHGFSGKDADGVTTHGTGWGAHASLPEELEREFEFMHVRRAMLVCRVVAGRVALGKREAFAATEVDGDGYGYDSAVVAGRAGGAWTAEDVLLAFNPRAVLPCFVIMYSV